MSLKCIDIGEKYVLLQSVCEGASLDEAYELYQKNRILCWAACSGSK